MIAKVTRQPIPDTQQRSRFSESMRDWPIWRLERERENLENVRRGVGVRRKEFIRLQAITLLLHWRRIDRIGITDNLAAGWNERSNGDSVVENRP